VLGDHAGALKHHPARLEHIMQPSHLGDGDEIVDVVDEIMLIEILD
jgi:hypothetical protein